MEKIRATQLAGLEKFAGTVFEGAQGKFTLDEYAYFDDTSLFSTASFDIATLTVAANSEQQLFYTPVGGTGQGFSTAVAAASSSTVLTLADTNLERGWDGGKAPANMAYVAVAGGFEIYAVTSAGLTRPFNAQNLFQIASNFYWTWNVGGDANPRLTYEPLISWPIGAGISVTSGANGMIPASATQTMSEVASNGGPNSVMRKFTFPLFFPPNIGVDCRVRSTRACTLSDTALGAANGQTHQGNALAAYTNGDLRIAFHLRGYKLSRIV